jgi:NAD kinase
LKFGIFVHPKRRKISVEQTATQLQSAYFLCSPNEPDVVIVVGGDGTFGYYGRMLAVPTLFVGVKENDILGSKARLAETTNDRLDKTLQDINVGRYWVIEKRMLSVNLAANTQMF